MRHVTVNIERWAPQIHSHSTNWVVHWTLSTPDPPSPYQLGCALNSEHPRSTFTLPTELCINAEHPRSTFTLPTELCIERWSPQIHLHPTNWTVHWTLSTPDPPSPYQLGCALNSEHPRSTFTLPTELCIERLAPQIHPLSTNWAVHWTLSTPDPLSYYQLSCALNSKHYFL